MRYALEGVVLVDFGQYLAGPFGPMIIGDLGADVIKVEPIAGDGMRFVNQAFFGCQRGKRDIALDLKSERGHEIALQLVERADIVHHNMTAGRREAARHRVRGLQGGQRPTSSTATPGRTGSRARSRTSAGSTRCTRRPRASSTTPARCTQGNMPLYYRFGMTDTANAMLSVVGCLAALYHQRTHRRGPGLVDVAARRRGDVLLGRAARRRCRRCPARSSMPTRPASARATACTSPPTGGSRSPRSKPRHWEGLCRGSARPS